MEIFLPICQDEIELEEIKETIYSGGSESILVVDDEGSVAEMVKLMLKQLGYSVDVYNDSLDALEIIRTNSDKYDLG